MMSDKKYTVELTKDEIYAINIAIINTKASLYNDFVETKVKSDLSLYNNIQYKLNKLPVINLTGNKLEGEE
jgi:hypothetical protein